jgi:serine/threonine-protein kinase
MAFRNRDSQPDDWVPRPRTMIADRYRVGAVIGRGGMGAVVAAEHVRLGERIAMKFLDPVTGKDIESLERFFREARATARIGSEHVVRILDVGTTEDGLPYIAMERLEGNDLGDELARGQIPIQLAVDCVLQAAEALAAAHAAGIVHRDIKPSNLWLSRRSGEPFVKVLDFGISKLVQAEEEIHLTTTKSIFGTPAYMSPEQIRSSKRVDHRTDIWALGVVLYELLSGRLPFEADNAAGFLVAIATDPPAPLAAARADVPPELVRLVRLCLEKDPARRISLRDLGTGLGPFASPVGQQAAARLAVLEPPPVRSTATSDPSVPAIISGSELPTLRQGSLARTMNTLRRYRSWIGAAITLSVAAVVLLGSVAIRSLRGHPPPVQPETRARAEPVGLGASPRAQAEPVPSPSSTPPSTEALPPSSQVATTSNMPAPAGSRAAPPRGSARPARSLGEPRHDAVPADSGPGLEIAPNRK